MSGFVKINFGGSDSGADEGKDKVSGVGAGVDASGSSVRGADVVDGDSLSGANSVSSGSGVEVPSGGGNSDSDSVSRSDRGSSGSDSSVGGNDVRGVSGGGVGGGFAFKPLNLGERGSSRGGFSGSKSSVGGDSDGGKSSGVGASGDGVSGVSSVSSSVGGDDSVADSSGVVVGGGSMTSSSESVSLSVSDDSLSDHGSDVGSISGSGGLVVGGSSVGGGSSDDGIVTDFFGDDSDSVFSVVEDDGVESVYDDGHTGYDDGVYDLDSGFDDSVSLSNLYGEDDDEVDVSGVDGVGSSVGSSRGGGSSFGGSSGSDSGVGAGSNIGNGIDSFDGADDGIFTDFLGEDDDSPFEVARSFVSGDDTVSSSSSSSSSGVSDSVGVDGSLSVGEVDEVSVIVSSGSSVGGVESSGGVSIGDVVVLQSGRSVEDSMSEVDVVVSRVDREVRRERSERNRDAEAVDPVLDGSVAGFESDFFANNVDEVVVNDGGRSVRDEVVNARSADGTVAKSGGKRGKKQRYRYLREDGRMNGAELEFFKNLQTSQSSVLRGDDDVLDKLRAPVDGVESEVDRRKRSMLISQAMGGDDLMRRGSRLRFDDKDLQTLRFLAMFRYATDAQLAHMFSLARVTMYNRLKKMRLQGLVIDKKIIGTRPIWFLTDAGMLLSGMDLVRVTESKFTHSMFPHQFTVNNVAAHLWGANLNVLNQPDYPSRNRVNEKGVSVFGEELVSELEIQTVLGRKRKFDKADVFRPQLENLIEIAFSDWESAGGVSFGPSPEMLLGNEFMWAVLPPRHMRLAYHIPDLVVKRPRAADGSPESIAVEIELSNKNPESYKKTLLAYQSDTRIFKKVIWVCKGKGAAKKLERIAQDIGLWRTGRIEIVPIFTEDGVFRGRDVWTI